MIAKKKKLKITHRIYNNSLNNGNKKTVEKNLLKSLKKLQRISQKNCLNILLLAIKNSTSALKINKQKMKKRKKNKIQEVPTFVKDNFLRLNLAIKHLIINSKKRSESTNFYNKFAKEALETAYLKSFSINKKAELQKQILLKKNLFFKYRWKK